MLVGVISAGSEEEQRAAQPDLLRIVRQVSHSNTARRRDHDVARPLRAVPIATRVEIIVAAIRHPGIATRDTVYLISRAIARSAAPTVTMTTRPSRLPVSMGLLVTREVPVVALARRLGLKHGVGPTLDRQTALAVL